MPKTETKEEVKEAWDKLGFFAFHLRLAPTLDDQDRFVLESRWSFHIVRKTTFQLSELP
jgi:hypothetical protein